MRRAISDVEKAGTNKKILKIEALPITTVSAKMSVLFDGQHTSVLVQDDFEALAGLTPVKKSCHDVRDVVELGWLVGSQSY
jgi:hypothetical protein